MEILNDDDYEHQSISAASESNSIQESLDNEDESLAVRENRAVNYLRSMVISVLLIATFIASTSVYISCKRDETRRFQNAFFEAAENLLLAVESSQKLHLNALDTLSIDLSSVSRSINQSWPSFLIPDFAERADSIRALGNLPIVMVMPIVNHTSQESWETFAYGNQQWVAEGIQWEHAHGRMEPIGFDSLEKVERSLDTLPSIPRHIFDFNGTVSKPGQLLPLYETSPMTEELVPWVNFDWLATTVAEGVPGLFLSHKSILGKASLYHNESKSPEEQFLYTLLKGNGLTEGMASMVSYPVFSNRDKDRRVVAVLSSFVVWDHELVLAHSSPQVSLVAVIRNQCNQIFSYLIKDSQTTLLGPSDLHEREYRSMVKSLTLSPNAKDYHGAPFDGNHCGYTVSIYPSSTMETQFSSAKPIWVTMIVACTFFAVCGAFILYDHLVERRQKIVMDRAIQSTNIISSLFPHQVRDRLFHDDQNRAPDNQAAAFYNNSLTSNASELMVQPAKNRLKTFLNDHGAIEHGGANKTPIADLFPHCTVLCKFTRTVWYDCEF